MHLSIQSLQIFLAVAENGSLSSAARRLYMSQPSVSAHVRQLETSLSAHLLDRGPTGTTLTAAGEVLADHARRVVAVLDQVDDSVAAAQGIQDRRLTVAGTSSLGSYLLPQVLSRFLTEHPGTRTELRIGNGERVAEWLISREVSLAVCAGRLGHEQLHSTELFDDQLVLIAPPDHRLAGRLVDAGDLVSERFLLREIGSSTRADQDRALLEWGLQGAESWTLWSAEAAREAVRAGLGIALVSEHVVARDLRSGDLAHLDVRPAPPARKVWLVRRGAQPLTALEHDFVFMLKTLATWPTNDQRPTTTPAPLAADVAHPSPEGSHVSHPA